MQGYNLGCVEEVEQRIIRQVLEATVFEELVESVSMLIDGVSIAVGLYEIKLGNVLFSCQARRDAFNRFFITPNTIQVEGKRVSLDEFVVHLEGVFSGISHFINELKLTRHFTGLSERGLQFPESRRGYSYRSLEMALHEGHPYHPCFKSRVGFSDQDHMDYSPEYAALIKLVALEVDNDLLVGDLDVSGTSILWVHPWQWERIHSHERVVALMASGGMRIAESQTQYCQATQSLRTVMPEQGGDDFHIKLPLSLVNSSSIRTLDHESVISAKVISSWLDTLVKEDEYLSSQDVKILVEYGGVMLKPDGNESLLGQLGHLYRESPMKGRESSQQLVPATALIAKEEDGDYFIKPWIHQHGWEKWFTHLVRVVVVPIWHLLMRYAVGSEWHAQNMIIVLDDGLPTGVVLRDFHDGVEYHEESLPLGVTAPDFSSLGDDAMSAEAHYRVSTFDSVKDLVLECLFIYNFCQIGRVLTDGFSINEKEVWRIVERELSAHYEKYPDLIARHEAYESEMDVIRVESLLAGKVKPQLASGFYNHVETNPLKLELYVYS